MMFRGQFPKLKQNFKAPPKNPLKIQAHVPVIACCNIVALSSQIPKIAPFPTQSSPAQKIRIKRVASQKTVKITVEKDPARCLSNQPLKQGQNLAPQTPGKKLWSEKKQQALCQDQKTTFKGFQKSSSAETALEILGEAKEEGQSGPLFNLFSRDGLSRRNTFPFSKKEPRKQSTFLTICKAVDQTFFFNAQKSLKIDPEQSPKSSPRSSTSILSTEREEHPQQRLNSLGKQIAQAQQLLWKRHKQLKQTEQALTKNREKIQQYDEELKEYLTLTQEVFRRRKIMEEYLTAQPNITLRMQAQQYKKNERKLLILAKNMQLYNYDSLTTTLRQAVEIPQQYLFQTIKKVSSLQDNNAAMLSDRLKSSYTIIMDKVKGLLRQRCCKIQEFQQCLTELAGRAIGKQQYLNEINNRMINISAHFGKLCHSLPALPPQGQLPLLQEIKQIVDTMSETYNSAQIYY